MSEISILETIEPLETSIKLLSEDSKIYESLKVLTKSIPNLLKLDQTISNYKKKTSEIKEILKTNKNLLKIIKENSLVFNKKIQNKLISLKDLPNKFTNNEKSIKDIIEEKKLEIFVKKEVCGAVNHIEGIILNQNKKINEELKRVTDDVDQYKTKANRGENEDAGGRTGGTPADTSLKKRIERFCQGDFETVSAKCNQLGVQKLESLEEKYKNLLESVQKIVN